MEKPFTVKDQATIEALQAIVDKANKASKICVGSEYFNDPAFVIKRLEERIHDQFELLKKKTLKLKEAHRINKMLVESINRKDKLISTLTGRFDKGVKLK